MAAAVGTGTAHFFTPPQFSLSVARAAMVKWGYVVERIKQSPKPLDFLIELDQWIPLYKKLKVAKEAIEEISKTVGQAISTLQEGQKALNPARVIQLDLLGLHAQFDARVALAKKEQQGLEQTLKHLQTALETNQARLSILTQAVGPKCYRFLSEKGQISLLGSAASYITSHDSYVQQYIQFTDAASAATATAAAPVAPAPAVASGAAAAAVQIVPTTRAAAKEETGPEMLARFFEEIGQHALTPITVDNTGQLKKFVQNTRKTLEQLKTGEPLITQTHGWRDTMTALNKLGTKLGTPKPSRLQK